MRSLSCSCFPTLALLLATLFQTASAIGDEPPEKLVIATWNVEWFFDHYTGDNRSDLSKKMSAPSKEEFEWKLKGLAAAIAQTDATIIALQEVENAFVTYRLMMELRNTHELPYRYAAIQGTDYYTEQDVVFLFKSGLVEYSRKLQSAEMFASKEYSNVQKQMIGRFEWGQGDDRESITILNVHLKAMPKGATLRERQCRLIQRWLGEQISRGENVIVLGDINTEMPFKETVDEATSKADIGILRGFETKSTDDDLFDLHAHLIPTERDTHLLPGKQFDRILVSRPLTEDDPKRRDFVFSGIRRRRDLCVLGKNPDKDHWNIYYEIPQEERDLSDHYPLVAEFEYR